MTKNALANAEWPSTPVPQAVKDAMRHFYALVDSAEPSSGAELANEVFTPDGQWTINKRKMEGREQISNWRGRLAEAPKRVHEVGKIYTCDESGGDLLMTGNIKLIAPDGTTAESDYCARCVVDDPTKERCSIKYWQGWSNISVQVGIAREK